MFIFCCFENAILHFESIVEKTPKPTEPFYARYWIIGVCFYFRPRPHFSFLSLLVLSVCRSIESVSLSSVFLWLLRCRYFDVGSYVTEIFHFLLLSMFLYLFLILSAFLFLYPLSFGTLKASLFLNPPLIPLSSNILPFYPLVHVLFVLLSHLVVVVRLLSLIILFLFLFLSFFSLLEN